jgi:hypothetical protein
MNNDIKINISLNDEIDRIVNELEEKEQSVTNIENMVEKMVENGIEEFDNNKKVIEEEIINKGLEEIKNGKNIVENVVEKSVKKVVDQTVDKIITNPYINNLSSATSLFSKMMNPFATNLMNNNNKNSSKSSSRSENVSESSRSSSRSESRRSSRNTDKIIEEVENKSEKKEEEINTEKEKQNKEEQNKTNVFVTTRNRKQDRRNLASDINSELPISIRFNDNINIDNNEVVNNYIEDWKIFENNDDDCNKIDILMEEIYVNEEKYKKLSEFNHNCARSIQFTLILMGMLGIFLQAKGATPETVNNFTIASSGITTLTTSLLTFFSFSKKSPHFSKISFMLRRLRNWMEKLIVVPVGKRVSPYDLYVISKISFETILTEAREGLNETK